MATKKTLVIVESPSKAKTIGGFLGSKYKVIASVGHVRDLPKSRMAVDIEHDFQPEYINVRGKAAKIKEIKAEAAKAGKIYLATDPDREGEAISWHIAGLLGMDVSTPCRVVFHEITKPAILAAVKEPKPIDMSLVNAQQGRRVIDRVVGYSLSPILWAKVKRGLAAGRVQSATLKIICDRERAIKAFVPKEFWNIVATLTKQELTPAKEKKATFNAKLAEYKGKKLTVEDKVTNDNVLKELKAGTYTVDALKSSERVRKPYAPYTTSTMQQDASVKLGYNVNKTRMLAQQLYEGVNIKGHGTVGLITYTRTDSVRISDEADAACKSFITENYTPDYVGKNVYTNKKKGVQDAHEAIRPSYVDITPDEAKGSLEPDQFKLYRLIWSRFVASRMKPATYDMMNVDIKNGDYTFKAQGSKLKFDGWLKVYSDTEEKDNVLPELSEGEQLKLLDITGGQSFTQPPSRFTEASLIKEMEEKGIGRPSTYVPTVSNLEDKRYVSREKKSLVPTDLGFVVTEMLEEYFKDVVDTAFTASMEEKLDGVELGESRWQDVVSSMYNGGFKDELTAAESGIEKIHMEPVLSDEVCELCGKPMAIKEGRFGRFLACTGFPDCKNTKPIIKKVGVACPVCGKDLVVKKSKRGKVFFGCSGYPDCTQSYWYEPVDKKCPKCGSLLMKKKGKGHELSCSNEDCDYTE